MSVTDRLLHNNRAYAGGFASRPPASAERKVAVVACMDARMDVYAILGLREGEAHVIRNAGGAVTEDVIRSLLVSQWLLGTEEVILLHHTGCGMLTFTDDEVKAQVQADTGVRPAFALEAFSDLEEEVRQSLARIEASPFVPRKESVRGFVYEVETGLLREVSAGGEEVTLMGRGEETAEGLTPGPRSDTLRRAPSRR
ncbi:MAG: carbonic anhydrase [Chloroflexi bacterium]|nr:carbonic anhydrase [Chloroflexota bacterium]